MTLAVHAAVGMLVGRLTGNPILAMGSGIASHFLLDMIPHGDEYLLHNYHKKHRVNESVAYVVADVLLTAGVLGFLFTHGMFSKSFSGLMGAVGGLIPDFLVGIYELFPRKMKLLAKYVSFHHHNHHILIKKFFRERDVHHTWALLTQGIFVALFLGLIVK